MKPLRYETLYHYNLTLLHLNDTMSNYGDTHLLDGTKGVNVMYNGFTESAEKIAKRKARILKRYKPAQRKNKKRGRKPSPRA
jgi:hypothetical protein